MYGGIEMKQFVNEKLNKLRLVDLEEDLFTVNGDINPIKIAASPIRKSEVRKMFEQGHGIRILVGTGDMSNFMAVWIGDSNSNKGAMHDTIADQLGITGVYVPLEKSAAGRLEITTTGKGFFDSPRDAEDLLDRNSEYRKIFGDEKVDYSKLETGW